MAYLVCRASERSGLTSASTASDLATTRQRDILSRQGSSCAAMVLSMLAGAVAVTTIFRSWVAIGALVQMEKLARCRGRTKLGPTPVRSATALRNSTGRWSRFGGLCGVLSCFLSCVSCVSSSPLSLSLPLVVYSLLGHVLLS